MDVLYKWSRNGFVMISTDKWLPIGWDNFTNGKRGMYRNNIELYKPWKPIILNVAGTADLF